MAVCQTIDALWDATELAGCELLDDATRTELVNTATQTIAATGMDVHCDLTLCGQAYHLGNF